MKRKKQYYDEIYKACITVYLNYSKEELQAIFDKIDFDFKLLNTPLAKTIVDIETGYTVLWIPNFGNDLPTRKAVVHEIYHIAYQGLKYRGIASNDETEEAFAYYIEYLFGLIYPDLFPTKSTKS